MTELLNIIVAVALIGGLFIVLYKQILSIITKWNSKEKVKENKNV